MPLSAGGGGLKDVRAAESAVGERARLRGEGRWSGENGFGRRGGVGAPGWRRRVAERWCVAGGRQDSPSGERACGLGSHATGAAAKQ